MDMKKLNVIVVINFEENKPTWFMDEITTENLFRFIKSFGNLPVDITWFGGEPLLNFKKIVEISNHLIRENIEFSSSILTNGYLLSKSKIDKLKELKITNVQVTLDGSREVHNAHRPHKKGYKTFDKIIDNLDYLLPYSIENNIEVNIPITIDTKNKEDFINIYTFLKERYFDAYTKKVLRISINFVHSRDDKPTCKISEDDKVAFYTELADNELIDKEFIKKFLIPGKNAASCMMRKVNSFGIGPKGYIYKCLEDFSNPAKAIGNINDKTLDFDKLAKFTIGSDVFDDEICLECEMLPICTGGCPYDILNGKKTNYHGHNCSLYKNKMGKVLTQYYTLHNENE